MEAVEWAADPNKKLALEPTASGTRDACAATTKGLRRRLADVDAHEEFLVDLDNHLLDGEEDRAREWAVNLTPVASH